MEIRTHIIDNDQLNGDLVNYKNYFNFIGYYAKHTIKGKEITCFHTEDRLVFFVPCSISALNVIKTQVYKFRKVNEIPVEIYNCRETIRKLMDKNPKEFI